MSPSTSRPALVSLTHQGHARILTLDAPGRLNALDTEMLEEISDAVSTVRADPEARILVVAGAGRAFCAGADPRSFGDPSRDSHLICDQLKASYRRLLALRDLAIPTIAAVHGLAVGAGVNLALACDIVVAGPSAEFRVSFVDLGLHPGGGSSWLLTRRLGTGRALMTVLGGAHISASEAIAQGLADVLADDALETALQLASRYASLEDQLVRDVTRSIRMSRDGGLPEVLDFEAWAQARSVGRGPFRQFLADFSAQHP